MDLNLQQAFDYLCAQPVLHMAMLEALRRKQAKLLIAKPQGVLLHHTTAQTYMLSAQDTNTAAQMMNTMSIQPDMVVAHQSSYLSLLRARFDFTRHTACHSVAYLSTQPLPYPAQAPDIRALTPSHLDFLLAHYSHIPDPEYLSDRLQAGVMFGAYVGDQIAGFIGMHSEGSLGLLEVLPAYRRRGIAQALQIHMTNWCLGKGFTPFAQVVQGNQPSLMLQQKLGYTISKDLLYWLS